MLLTVLTLCLLTFISDITPGPNFWKIVHYSVFHSRRTALVFILGLSTSSAVHCILGFAGVSALIASFEHGLLVIQILGGAYISWYGIKLLLTRKRSEDQQPLSADQAPVPSRKSRLWMDGLLTNFSNPKTILFYASLFAITLTPGKPMLEVSFILVCLLLTSFLTNLMVACIFSLAPVQRVFRRWQVAINRVIGGLLVVAGIKIALQNRA